GAGLFLAPGANALQTADAVRARMVELEKKFPAGLTWSIPYDTSKYVRVSMNEVLITFLEAMTLVFLVVWLFLHKLRATLIPRLLVLWFPPAVVWAVGFWCSKTSSVTCAMSISTRERPLVERWRK